MLSLIEPKFKDDVDSTVTTESRVYNATPREIVNTKQEVSNIFKSNGPKVTFEAKQEDSKLP